MAGRHVAHARGANDANRTAAQIRFIELVIDELTRNGSLEAGRLYERPFTDLAYSGPELSFEERDVGRILDISTLVRERAFPAGEPGPTATAPVGVV